MHPPKTLKLKTNNAGDGVGHGRARAGTRGRLKAAMDRFLGREQDRELFDLPPRTQGTQP